MPHPPYIPSQTDRADELAATRELLALGLELVGRGAPGIPEAAVHDWLLSDEELPFPSAIHGPLSEQGEG